jgi:hypothetical protein
MDRGSVCATAENRVVPRKLVTVEGPSINVCQIRNSNHVKVQTAIIDFTNLRWSKFTRRLDDVHNESVMKSLKCWQIRLIEVELSFELCQKRPEREKPFRFKMGEWMMNLFQNGKRNIHLRMKPRDRDSE